MALIGSDFVPAIQTRKTCCSECGITIPRGAEALEAIRNGRCKKRVCSEKCRIDFDDKFWRKVAMTKKKKMKNGSGHATADEPVESYSAPDWTGRCEVCNASPIVPETGMCGPCSFGEGETAGGNW